MASWSVSSSRAGGGKGNRWEVGGSKELGGVSFTKEGCCRENELGLQALEGRERPWGQGPESEEGAGGSWSQAGQGLQLSYSASSLDWDNVPDNLEPQWPVL